MSWFAWLLAPEEPRTPDAKRQRRDDEPAAPRAASAWDDAALAARQRRLGSLPAASQQLLSELFRVLCGEEEVCGEDETVLERDPGFEKAPPLRQADCARVRHILSCGASGVDASWRSIYGETLVHLALEYDHRHPPEMLLVVLEAGADPTARNELDGELAVESSWLACSEDEHVVAKRECILQFCEQWRRGACYATHCSPATAPAAP
ncbi:hypothetical protein AB1Y20_007277 [Prymnesium parvum]|uniref:Uncharacterized protein n=1 Tax=Prymnesium parvum TaxID=97485 RepID=A0AB34IUZ7_PRYPA